MIAALIFATFVLSFINHLKYALYFALRAAISCLHRSVPEYPILFRIANGLHFASDRRLLFPAGYVLHPAL
jgi:hypothetical protein